jgi:hypothetical protein
MSKKKQQRDDLVIQKHYETTKEQFLFVVKMSNEQISEMIGTDMFEEHLVEKKDEIVDRIQIQLRNQIIPSLITSYTNGLWENKEEK